MSASFSEAQTLLEAWWNEDPEMRHVEIMCGENLRVYIRLFVLDMDSGDDKCVGSAEAGTLEQAIKLAVEKANGKN